MLNGCMYSSFIVIDRLEISLLAGTFKLKVHSFLIAIFGI